MNEQCARGRGGCEMSTEAKHTPGPWVYSRSFHPGLSDYINIHQADGAPYTSESSDVATVSTVACRRETAEANARLIAAAPELLGVVEALVVQLSLAGCDAVEDSNNPLEALHWRAREAVGKTTGKGLG